MNGPIRVRMRRRSLTAEAIAVRRMRWPAEFGQYRGRFPAMLGMPRNKRRVARWPGARC